MYYWLVAGRAWYAARAFPLERERQFVGRAHHGVARAFPLERERQSMEQARRGASQAFLMRPWTEREQGARQ